MSATPSKRSAAKSERQRIVIGEFDLKHLGRYRAYLLGESRTVSLSRVYPDAERGRNIATVQQPGSDQPDCAWPETWSPEQRADAEAKVRLLWKHHIERRTDQS